MSTALESLRVLVVDCQSTGANPVRGHLLELAWTVTTAAADIDEPRVRSHLVSLPPRETIPRRISALTGIVDDQLAGAIPPAEAWAALEADVPRADDGEVAWAVAHFARFEEPFLRDLHARFGSGSLPLRLVCTREIARHVAPELPRHGLRALAGNLGHPLPETRRAADHVRATARIWHELCERLADRGIVDSDELLALLEAPPPKRGEVGRVFPLSEARRKELPDRPGVYRFVDPSGRVLYVGKAAALRQRVATYYQPRGYRLATTLEMLTQAFDVAVTETATPLEAALLEVDEIKRLDPPYNTALRERGDRTPASEMLEAIARAVDEPATALENAPLLGLTFPEPPDLDIISQGVDLFREVVLAERDPTPTRLSAIGAILWWRRYEKHDDTAESRGEGPESAERRDGVHPRPQNQSNARPTAGDKPPPYDEASSPAWTPVRVARALLRTAIHAAHLERRETWLTLISECAIKWTPKRRGADNDARMLTVTGGRIADATDVEPSEPIVPPPGWDTPLARRRAQLDRATADRLRVLTTELRRLVGEGALTALCLGPDTELGPDRAGQLLECV